MLNLYEVIHKLSTAEFLWTRYRHRINIIRRGYSKQQTKLFHRISTLDFVSMRERVKIGSCLSVRAAVSFLARCLFSFNL
jgi:hypothetical protein